MPESNDMTTSQNSEFQQLLQAWNEHQDLRKQGGSISHLVESRSALEQARRPFALTA